MARFSFLPVSRPALGPEPLGPNTLSATVLHGASDFLNAIVAGPAVGEDIALQGHSAELAAPLRTSSP
jgi:hypothetical protein